MPLWRTSLPAFLFVCSRKSLGRKMGTFWGCLYIPLRFSFRLKALKCRTDKWFPREFPAGAQECFHILFHVSMWHIEQCLGSMLHITAMPRHHRIQLQPPHVKKFQKGLGASQSLPGFLTEKWLKSDCCGAEMRGILWQGLQLFQNHHPASSLL